MSGIPSLPDMTQAEWMAEGRRRFGDDQMKWRFVCPVCGHVATPEDYKAAGAPSTAVAFSCVGRWSGAKSGLWRSGDAVAKPCDYAGGGLFRLNPQRVIDEQGVPHELFAFEEAQCQATKSN